MFHAETIGESGCKVIAGLLRMAANIRTDLALAACDIDTQFGLQLELSRRRPLRAYASHSVATLATSEGTRARCTGKGHSYARPSTGSDVVQPVGTAANAEYECGG